MNPIDFEDYSNPSEREEDMAKSDWNPETNRDEYFLTENEVKNTNRHIGSSLDSFLEEKENRPDRLSQIIRDTEELIKDYAPEDDEVAPLWREFLITGVQALRLADKTWDLEVELEEMKGH